MRAKTNAMARSMTHSHTKRIAFIGVEVQTRGLTRDAGFTAVLQTEIVLTRLKRGGRQESGSRAVKAASPRRQQNTMSDVYFSTDVTNFPKNSRKSRSLARGTKSLPETLNFSPSRLC